MIVSPPLSTQVTAAAAFQIPFDAVSVIVPLVGIVVVGVTTKAMAVGVLGKATPPVGVAEVQPTDAALPPPMHASARRRSRRAIPQSNHFRE